jgi:hypothetical protein
MVIIVYAHTSPETMFSDGIKAGLSEEAADFFRYFQEIKLKLEVEESTGRVISVKSIYD